MVASTLTFQPLVYFAPSANILQEAILLLHFFRSRGDEMVGVSSLLFAISVLIPQLCRVTVRSGELRPGLGRFPKGLFLSLAP